MALAAGLVFASTDTPLLYVRISSTVNPFYVYDVARTYATLYPPYLEGVGYTCAPLAASGSENRIAISATIGRGAGTPDCPMRVYPTVMLNYLPAGRYYLDVTLSWQNGSVAGTQTFEFEVGHRGTRCNVDPLSNAFELALEPAKVAAFLSGPAADPQWRLAHGNARLLPSYVDGAGNVRIPGWFDPLADPYIVVDRLRASSDFLWVSFPTGLGCGFPECPGDLHADLIEYRNTSREQYFYTFDAAEIQALDAGTIAGWTRTGETTRVIRQAGSARALEGVFHRIYRFWGGSVAGIPSHFFTVSQEECAVLRDRTDWNWTYEGSPFWARETVEGACPVGAILYRLYNNAADGAPAHRYTTRLAIVDEMSSRRWTNEGAAMCVAGP